MNRFGAAIFATSLAATAVGALQVTGVLIALPFLLFRAWIFSMFWAWFAVPILGLPAISLLQATGLLLLIMWIKVKPSDYDVLINFSIEALFNKTYSDFFKQRRIN